jgi:hypothetical protein
MIVADFRITLLLTVISLQAAFSGDKVVVVGQNVENFYYSTAITGNTEAKREAKMEKILNAYFPSDGSVPAADIYAFCEVECSNEMMQWIATCFSNKTGKNYQASLDDLSYDFTNPNYQSGVTKVGFVYDASKIETVGENVSAAVGYNSYKERIRMQTFKVKSSGECFTLSMNHFKAFGEESDREKRRWNATALLKGLDNTGDPDILVMGDLNSEMGEDCLNFLVSAGFEEQLIKHAGPTAWTHCYGGGEIIDHVFANKTMAQQVTDVEVKAANECSMSDVTQAFSDHNFYVITLDLQEQPAAKYVYKKASAVTAGKSYLMVANNTKVANTVNATKSYEYLSVTDVTPTGDIITMSSAKNNFTFDDAGNGGYIIRDYYGRYLYAYYNTSSSSYNWTISVGNKEDANTFTVTKNADETFLVHNNTPNYNILYQSNYNNFSWRNWTSLSTGNYWPTLWEYDPTEATGIETVTQYREPRTTRKVMENGRLVIVTSDGKKYTMTGIEIR